MKLGQNRDLKDFLKLEEGDTLYREVFISDGKQEWSKYYVKLMASGAVEMIQFGEREDPEGAVIIYSQPIEFPDMNGFLDWLFSTVASQFDAKPYMSIKPIDNKAIKKREREIDQSMYW